MLKVFSSKQFVLFLIVGFLSASTNFASRIIYSEWFEFSEAVFFAYITGMMVAFTLDKFFVFEKGQKGFFRSVLFFCLVNIVGLTQAWLATMCLAYYVMPFIGIVHYKNEISHALGICVPVVTSFLGHKYFTFR